MRFRHTVGKMSGGIRLSIVRFKAVRLANIKKQPYDYVRLSGYFKSFTTICRYKGCTTIFKNAGRLCDYETFTTIQLYDYTTINRLRLSAVKKAIRLSGVIVYDYTTIRPKKAYNYVTKKGLHLS